MFFCGLYAFAGAVLVVTTPASLANDKLSFAVMGVVMAVLFGWLFMKARAAFLAVDNGRINASDRTQKQSKKYLSEKTKYKIKMGVSLTAAAAGIVMISTGREDLLQAGAPLIMFGLIFAFGFSHSHKKWLKQQDEAKEREQARNAFQGSIDRVAAMNTLPVVNSVSVVLRPDEICHYQEPASVLQVKNEVVGHTSGSAGVSVRVAKGLTLHSGGSRGHAIRQNVAHLHPGYLTITNQRFVMTGDKGFDHPLSKLTAMTPYNGYEGIMLQFGRSVYTVIMDEPFIVPKIWDLLQANEGAVNES